MTQIRRMLREENREGGFSLIELIVIIPVGLLIALIAVEATWFFIAQRNISDAAVEGSRLAAANFGNTPQIGQSVCNVVDVDHPTTSPDVVFVPKGLDGTTGDSATITVKTPIRSFSGILSPLFRRITVSSTVEFILRRPDEGSALWWNNGQESAYSCRLAA